MADSTQSEKHITDALVDWISKSQDKIGDAYSFKRGWEAWAQAELTLYLEDLAGPGKQFEKVEREVAIYKPREHPDEKKRQRMNGLFHERCDILLTMNSKLDKTYAFELKVQADTKANFLRDVKEDREMLVGPELQKPYQDCKVWAIAISCNAVTKQKMELAFQPSSAPKISKVPANVASQKKYPEEPNEKFITSCMTIPSHQAMKDQTTQRVNTASDVQAAIEICLWISKKNSAYGADPNTDASKRSSASETDASRRKKFGEIQRDNASSGKKQKTDPPQSPMKTQDMSVPQNDTKDVPTLLKRTTQGIAGQAASRGQSRPAINTNNANPDHKTTTTPGGAHTTVQAQPVSVKPPVVSAPRQNIVAIRKGPPATAGEESSAQGPAKKAKTKENTLSTSKDSTAITGSDAEKARENVSK